MLDSLIMFMHQFDPLYFMIGLCIIGVFLMLFMNGLL